MAKIELYDTTLRDGMQTEGVSFSLADKLAIAKCLDELGVNYLEGGYAGSNPKEMEFFKEAKREKFSSAKLVAFGSTRKANTKVEDDALIQAVLSAQTEVVTLVGKTWDFHVKNVLRCSLEENLKICSESVEYIKKHGAEVIFDAEHFYDAYKNNAEYAMRVLSAAVDAGADVVALCDTNGGTMPADIRRITKEVCERFNGVRVGIHTHNDSDCATANTLAAVESGAVHVQGTLNGLGERCGNANLCVVIPNLAFKMGLDVLSEEKLKMLTETSRLIFEICNMSPVMNMPYVGESAFAHKAGLHVDALRKNRQTYEHIDPELIGNERKFLVSELSGRSNVLAQLEKTKIAEDKKLAHRILERVQDLENEGYQFEAADASFDLLVKKVMGTYKPAFELEKYHVTVEQELSGQLVTEATVKLNVDGVTEHVVAEGDGPVNALDAALRKSLENFYPVIKEIRLIDYKVRVVNARAGTAAKVRVIIESSDRETIWGTVGVSENIIEASWQALVDSVEYKLLKNTE